MTASVLSLCTGYGGLDLAVEAVIPGAHARWVSDIDRDACAVQAVRFPDAEQLGDLKLVDWSALAGQVDIITAGYPCQPFSTAGRRQGTDDPRHLWPWVADAIRLVGPRLVVLENVAGHLALGFDSVLADLAEMGMSARWGVVRASDVGAPHRRERLFVVAHPSGDGLQGSCNRPRHLGCGGSVPEASRGTVAAGTAADASVADGRRSQLAGMVKACGSAAESGERNSDDPAADTDVRKGQRREPMAGAARLGQQATAQLGDGGDTSAADADSSRSQRTEPTQRCDLPARRVAADTDGQAGCGGAGLSGATERTRPTGGSASTDWGRFGPAIEQWERHMGRAAPAPLVDGTRQLNARFVEWMMGLPEGWVTDIVPNRRALKVLGNGVVPQQAAMALGALL